MTTSNIDTDQAPSSRQRRNRARESALVVEKLTATIIFALPIAYLVTDYSRSPWFWRYSGTHLAILSVYTIVFAALIGSYRRPISRPLRVIRSAAVLGSFCSVLAAATTEVGLRLLEPAKFETRGMRGHYVADPDVGHVYLPDFELVISTREWQTRWRSNSEGVRADREFGPKPLDVFRILAIGDSFTVGDQVRLDQTWPGVLQKLLDRSGRLGKTEVVNGGCAAYGTINEARWLKKHGSQFEPDFVILAMTPNDLMENHFPFLYTAVDGGLAWARATDDDRRRFEDRQRWYSLPGYLGRSRLVKRLKGSPWLRRVWHGSAFTHHGAYRIVLEEESSNAYERTKGFLLEARDTAYSMGADFGVLIVPFREQLGALEPDLSASVFGERWVQFGEENGIAVVDALAAFRSHPSPESLFWRSDTHCTAAGYALLGQAADVLLQKATAARSAESR